MAKYMSLSQALKEVEEAQAALTAGQLSAVLLGTSTTHLEWRVSHAYAAVTRATSELLRKGH